MAGEDGFVVDDDAFDDLVDVRLAGHWVLTVRDGHQCRPEANGQIVRVHHVLIAILGQAETETQAIMILGHQQ